MRIYSENCFNVPEDSEKKNLCIYIYMYVGIISPKLQRMATLNESRKPKVPGLYNHMS